MPLAGVPDRRPVEVLKLNQPGRPLIEKVSASPFGSEAVGVKLHAVPTTTEVLGVPPITGGLFDGGGGGVGGAALTVNVNAGNCVVALPSLTEIRMLE